MLKSSMNRMEMNGKTWIDTGRMGLLLVLWAYIDSTQGGDAV